MIWFEVISRNIHGLKKCLLSCKMWGWSRSRGGYCIWRGWRAGTSEGVNTRMVLHGHQNESAAVQAVGRIADCRQRDLDIDTYIVISDPEYVLNEITNWIYKRKWNMFVNAAGINIASTDFWTEPGYSLQESRERILFWKWKDRRRARGFNDQAWSWIAI